MMPYNPQSDRIEIHLNVGQVEDFLGFMKENIDAFEEYCLRQKSTLGLAAMLDDMLDSRLEAVGVNVAAYGSRGEAMDAYQELCKSIKGIE